MAQQLTMPPASMEHRFCSVLQASLSLQTQLIFIPPVQRSTLNVQRGTINQFIPAGAVAGIPVVPSPGVVIPGMAMLVRSIIIALDIGVQTPFLRSNSRKTEDARSNGQ